VTKLPVSRNTLWDPIVKGVSWNAVNLVINKGLSIIVRLLFARFLAPEDFGLFAMVIVFLELIAISSDFGYRNALIQRVRDGDSPLRYSTAFWFLASLGAFWTVVFIFIATPLMVWVYADEKISVIAQAMGFSIFLQCLSIVPEVRLTRLLKYKRLAVCEISASLGANSLAIALAAYLDFGVWSLVAQQLAFSTIRTGLLWKVSGWRPRAVFSTAKLVELSGFSGWVFGTQVVFYARTNLDKLVIGAVLGSEHLGVYTIAYLITENLRSQISRIVSRVMLPVYSKMQSRPQDIGPHYLEVCRAMSFLLFPFLLPIVLYADQIISLLFDSQWAPAAEPAKILAVGGMIFAISGPAPEVLQGIGKARDLFRLSTFVVVTVSAPLTFMLTLTYGVDGAAWAMVLSFVAMRFFSFIALKNYIYIDLTGVVVAALPAVISSIFIFFSLNAFPVSGVAFGSMYIFVVFSLVMLQFQKGL